MSKESWRSLKKVRMDRRALSTSPQGSLFVKSMPANIKKNVIVSVAMEIERKWYFVTKIVLTYCCSRDRGKRLKFEAEGREFAKFLRSLEQFIQTVKG